MARASAPGARVDGTSARGGTPLGFCLAVPRATGGLALAGAEAGATGVGRARRRASVSEAGGVLKVAVVGAGVDLPGAARLQTSVTGIQLFCRSAGEHPQCAHECQCHCEVPVSPATWQAGYDCAPG